MWFTKEDPSLSLSINIYIYIYIYIYMGTFKYNCLKCWNRATSSKIIIYIGWDHMRKSGIYIFLVHKWISRIYWLVSATWRALDCPHVHNQKVVHIWTFIYIYIYIYQQGMLPCNYAKGMTFQVHFKMRDHYKLFKGQFLYKIWFI